MKWDYLAPKACAWCLLCSVFTQVLQTPVTKNWHRTWHHKPTHFESTEKKLPTFSHERLIDKVTAPALSHGEQRHSSQLQDQDKSMKKFPIPQGTAWCRWLWHSLLVHPFISLPPFSPPPPSTVLAPPREVLPDPGLSETAFENRNSAWTHPEADPTTLGYGSLSLDGSLPENSSGVCWAV